MIHPNLTISFTKVKLDHGWLGNMSPHPIVFEGKTWRTSEALFQALRFDDKTEAGKNIRELIRNEKSPMSAKMVAKTQANDRSVKPLSETDIDNMRMVLRLKFDQHPDIKTKLIQTGNRHIYEDCTARKPSPWGAVRVPDPDSNYSQFGCNWKWEGMNILGNLLVELRNEYQKNLEIVL